jgi:hypothetical protein
LKKRRRVGDSPGLKKIIKQELNDFHRESTEVHRGYKRYKSNNNSQKCATWSLFQGPLFLWCCGFWSKKNLRFKRIFLNDKRSVASDVEKFIKNM